MSLHIIIDGYNLIRQSDLFGAFHRQDLQTAREALVDALAAYKRARRHKITVVFDGTDAIPESVTRDNRKGVAVKFSRNGESADTLIKRMAARERERALVVSSDRDVAHFSTKQGAATIGSPEFEEKMTPSAFEESQGVEFEDTAGWVPTTIKKGPSKRLSKRQRRNRTRIKKL